jgi:hypothetical protein
MKLRTQWVTAIAASLAVTTFGAAASAQSRSTGIYNKSVRTASQNAAVPEDLPSRQMTGPGQMQPSYMPGPGNAATMSDGYYQGGYSDGQCCDDGYCSDCYSEPCCDSSNNWCSFGDLCGMGEGQFFVTADYLNVRASFSEATAFVRQDLNDGTDEFIPLEFDYDSSYRVGGGWRSCCCGDQIRFMFTNLQSEASDTAFPGDIVPYEAAPPPGGQTNISAEVDARMFDLECAKTIPLGGQCCDCCDPCSDGCGSGCGDACGKCCPAWDVTWSGGVRWAEIGWQRSYVAVDSNDFPVTDAEVGMNFQGGGLRTGLEGRRYFFKDGWLSIYGKGDISLLLGDVNVSSIRDVNDPSSSVNPVVSNTQTFRTRQIIPVTELEAGLTGQVSRHAAITAGYLFAAFHDLGFRDESELNTLLPVTYDDANILGFDGFFIRAEIGY